MPVLFPIESFLRKCNKYHGDEHFEIGVFYPDIDDFVAQKKAAGGHVPEGGYKPEPLKPEQEDAILKVYEQYKEGDGMSVERASRGAHYVGCSPSKEEEDNFARSLGGKKAQFDEFKNYVEQTRHQEDTHDELTSVYEYWDREKTGKVKADYFESSLKYILESKHQLTDDDTKWIMENFTTTDENGYVDYCDAIRRLMQGGGDLSGAPAAAKREDDDFVEGAAAEEPPEDYISLIFKENTATSPSGERRRTSQFAKPLYKANVAAEAEDFPKDKEYLNEDELREVVEAIMAKHSGDSQLLSSYFEAYDTTKTGKVSRNVVEWQVQAWGNPLTDAQAEQVVQLLAGSEQLIDYNQFCSRLLARPSNATIMGPDEQSSSSAQEMTTAPQHNTARPSVCFQEGLLASICELSSNSSTVDDSLDTGSMGDSLDTRSMVAEAEEDLDVPLCIIESAPISMRLNRAATSFGSL